MVYLGGICSNDLQKKFENVYKDFFHKYDLVVTSPFHVGIMGELSQICDGFEIFLTHPTYCFLGVKKIPGKEVVFSPVISYNLSINEFNQLPFFVFCKKIDQLIPFVQQYLKKHAISQGIEIGLLTEKFRGYGFNTSSTFVVCLASILMVFVGKIRSEDFENLAHFVGSSSFNELDELAHQMMDILMGTHDFPLVVHHYFEDGVCSVLNRKNSNNNNVVVESYHQYIKDIYTEKYLPIDCCILNFGTNYDKDMIDYFHQKNFFSLEKGLKKLLSVQENYGLTVDDSLVVQQPLLSLIDIHKKYLTSCFFDFLSYPYDDEMSNRFIDAQQKSMSLTTFFDGDNVISSLIYTLFHRGMHTPEQRISIVPLTVNKMGSSFLISTTFRIARDLLISVLDQVRELYPRMIVEYVSRLDGYTSTGIRVLQDLTHGKSTRYIDKNICEIYERGGSKLYDDYEEIKKKYPKYLIFDAVQKKVFWEGKELKIHGLVSKIFTFELLFLLLEKQGKNLSNKELPFSSYAKGKNQMIGKIILPLQKLVKKILGKDLNVECVGEQFLFDISAHIVSLPLICVRKKST